MKTPDYSKIPYPTIRKLLENEGMSSPSKLIPVCYNGNRDEYMQHQLSFQIDEKPDKVWEAYKVLHPADIWNTQMVKFGAVYDRKRDQYIYPDDSFSGLEQGQIYLINLKIFGGLTDLAVCHEVDMVDDEKKIIRLCYLNSGKTLGSQWIEFSESGTEGTNIVHRTLYKGNSFVRDRIFYPIFHSIASKQFHNRMRSLILSG